MFRRPPRNFRGRQRAASSCSSSSSSSSSSAEGEPEYGGAQGDEEQEQGPARPAAERQPPAEGPAGDIRGQEEEEDGGGGVPRGANPRAGQARGATALLSFGADEERDEGEELFKIKKPSLNTITFRMQRKENSHSAVREAERSKEIFQSESRIINSTDTCETEEEDEHYSSASEDYTSSASETQSSPPQKREDLSAGNIPDAAYIRVACGKRQLARTQGDYIPLDPSHRAPVSQKTACSDTESEDDSDHDTILHFAPKTKTLRQRMAEYAVPKSDGASEDDEIQNMWEEQQLNKGVRLPQGINVDSSLHKSRPMKIRFDPSVSLPPVNLEIVKKRLTTRMTSLQELHRAHQREHEKYTQDIESSKSTIQELERSSNAALNYKFYRSMKTYMESLIDCLNEKVLHINELESAMQMLLQQQAITLLKRRQEDLKNESAYVQLLSRKNVQSTDDSLEDDEKRKQLLEECEARRTCRRQTRESFGKSDHHEGMSSDDELSAAEMTDFQKNKGFVEHVWDPLSTSQTVSLVQLCKNIFEEHSLSKNESSKAKQDLVNSIVSRMKKSIEEDVFIPLYPKSTVEDRILPQSKFQERQFWSAVKLLSNILLWDGIIVEDTLHELGLGKLLNRYLLLILLNAPPGPDNVEKCNKVVACLPERWFKELKNGSTLPQLANFSQHLLQSAHILYKNNCSDETRDLILLLVKVNALHIAEDFIEEYKLEHLKSMVRK
ncbi:intron Large complex component GCFC2 isoform X6 [Chelonia mydas]|uniref:intron Large complex component GCFC2 isoform X6 n=1 Tax=Chelonia mydas TaxID=8469 RepID=UPI001CA830F0|nr:intron Large complex component GCFC2 isoform X6 [Chelonia mydas]